VIINLYVLGTGTKNRIRGRASSSNIVTVE
jgi:hypothetical protein